MKPRLIIVQGIPGTGKTTLSRKLAKDLGLPLIGKDDIKEFYFDRLGVGDGEWSHVLGRASVNALYILTAELLGTGKTFMIENAFWTEFASPAIGVQLERANVRCLELYCWADPAVRQERFMKRIETGERHQGHVEVTGKAPTEDEAFLAARYAPLNLGELIKVDLTHFGEAEYQQLLSEVKQILASQ